MVGVNMGGGVNMSYKNFTHMAIATLLLSMILILSGCGNGIRRAERGVENLLNQIDAGNFDGFSLRIYYLDRSETIPFPLSVNQLINGFYNNKIIIYGDYLQEHIELFRQITTDILVPAEYEGFTGVVLYYVFENRNNRNVFSVALQDCRENVLINGVEVKWNDMFIDIILPFLPESEIVFWERRLGRE